MNPKENIYTIDGVSLTNIDYGFFTNQEGESDGGGYCLDGKKTRNVNIYSPECKPESIGFDAPGRVLANIQKCFQELGAGDQETHKFFMTSYYANGGKSDPVIVTCDNLRDLSKLQERAATNLFFNDGNKENPNCLGLVDSMRTVLSQSDVSVVRADALIFKAIPEAKIAVLGPSGDAHPIMMFDDESKIACYIAGAHASIKQSVLERSVDEMVKLGADQTKIKVVIGPGLGPKSYEMGDDVVKNFPMPEEQFERVFTRVTNPEGKSKYLLNIKELISAKLIDKLPSENIHDIGLDTMGTDLYQTTVGIDGVETLKRRENIKRSDLLDLSFFSARLGSSFLSVDGESDHIYYNNIGRHGAGFIVGSA